MAEGETKQFPVWAMGLIGVACAGLIVGGIELARNQGRLVKDNFPLALAKASVRSHLTQNLDDPNFQELEWGPLRPYRNGHLISLRYRAKNAFNAWQLATDLFYVFDGGLLRIEDPNVSAAYANRSSP